VIKRLTVTQTILGTNLEIVLHEIEGARAGPTLGILSLVHGDEFATIPMVRQFLERIEPAKLNGRILAIPVASPRALFDFSRYTTELSANTDLHANFPGDARGSLTQMTARVITEAMLDRVDAFVDLHAAGAGGRFTFRVDFDYRLTGELRERILSLCRAFGSTLIHESDLFGTATGYCNGRSVPTVHAECGGSYLDPAANSHFERLAVDGLLRVAKTLGMIEDAPVWSGRQLLYDRKARIDVNPTCGGYLESYVSTPDRLHERIEKGTLLGRMIDPYTFEALADLIAPCSGPLFATRVSGMAEAGSKAYGIADEAASTWL
jgi:predicted deacylase